MTRVILGQIKEENVVKITIIPIRAVLRVRITLLTKSHDPRWAGLRLS